MGNKAFPTKTDLHSQTKKMIGTYVDETDAHRFAMISLTTGVSRSAILGDIIDGYLKDQPSLAKLIQTASKRIWSNWQELMGGSKLTDKSAMFNEYLKDTTADLSRHRISKNVTKRIIEEVRNASRQE